MWRIKYFTSRQALDDHDLEVHRRILCEFCNKKKVVSVYDEHVKKEAAKALALLSQVAYRKYVQEHNNAP